MVFLAMGIILRVRNNKRTTYCGRDCREKPASERLHGIEFFIDTSWPIREDLERKARSPPKKLFES